MYAELAGLDTIVFAVGFLEDEDYDEPEAWAPTDDNSKIVVMHKKDISEEMVCGGLVQEIHPQRHDSEMDG